MRLHPRGGFAFLHAEETLLHKASSADTQPKNTAAEGPFYVCQAFCADRELLALTVFLFTVDVFFFFFFLISYFHFKRFHSLSGCITVFQMNYPLISQFPGPL